MAAILILSPLTDRGIALIHQLECETGERAIGINHGTGDRAYYLSGGEDALNEFDAMLNRMEPAWREHIARSSRERAPRFSRVLRRRFPSTGPISP